MENGNLPAFAIIDTLAGFSYGGLTKREYFAIEFAKAIIINANTDGYSYNISKGIIPDAIDLADELLKELEK